MLFGKKDEMEKRAGRSLWMLVVLALVIISGVSFVVYAANPPSSAVFIVPYANDDKDVWGKGETITYIAYTTWCETGHNCHFTDTQGLSVQPEDPATAISETISGTKTTTQTYSSLEAEDTGYGWDYGDDTRDFTVVDLNRLAIGGDTVNGTVQYFPVGEGSISVVADLTPSVSATAVRGNFMGWHRDEEISTLGYGKSDELTATVSRANPGVIKLYAKAGEGNTATEMNVTIVVIEVVVTVDSELPGTTWDANIPLNATGGTGAYTSQQAKVSIDVTPDTASAVITLDLGATTYANFSSSATTTISEGQTKYLTGTNEGTYSITPKFNGETCGDATTGKIFNFVLNVTPSSPSWEEDWLGPTGYYSVGSGMGAVYSHKTFGESSGEDFCGATTQIWVAEFQDDEEDGLDYVLATSPTGAYAGKASANITVQTSWHALLRIFGPGSVSSSSSVSYSVTVGPLSHSWGTSESWSTEGCVSQTGGTWRYSLPDDSATVKFKEDDAVAKNANSNFDGLVGWIHDPVTNDYNIGRNDDITFNTVGTSEGTVCAAVSLGARTGDNDGYGIFGSFSGADLDLTLNSVEPTE